MRITLGNVSIEGNTTEELDICIEYIGKLSSFAPMREAKEKAPYVAKSLFSESQKQQAAEALAKGYSFEKSFLAVSGMATMKTKADEKERHGYDREGIAKERLEAIATHGQGEAMQGEQVPETTEELEESDL